jgi:hypothetical protein
MFGDGAGASPSGSTEDPGGAAGSNIESIDAGVDGMFETMFGGPGIGAPGYSAGDGVDGASRSG